MNTTTQTQPRTKSILFYTDATAYGGHEAMTVEAAQCFCRDPELKISFAFYLENKRLSEKLHSLQNSTGSLTLVPLKFGAKSLQALRSLLDWRKIEYLKALMKRIDPDVVVVSQGRIEASSLGLVAAKRAGFRTVSYIPMAHPVAISGRPFAVGIREWINGYFYRLPDRIITISEGARRMLRERGAACDVVVVPNIVETLPRQERDRELFRAAHGLREHEYAVATVGRIDFQQKGQDFALQAIARFRQQLRDVSFMFIGEGPDEDKLKAMIAKFDLSSKVKIVPWTPNRAQIYAGIDMLMIPSKFEGVPLVMLEAMASRLPIGASHVDGMAELLPAEWLFPFGDCDGLVETLLRIRNGDNSSILEQNRNRVVGEFTAQNFCAKFSTAVCAHQEPSRRVQS
ncbi:MAG: glycosyltransferase [Candidatus Sulfotelmatobacter sp.]